jgi:enoyl-CoA hydratase/carnithine racemase
MTEPLVVLERDADVAIVTFNDPKRRNAMTEAMGHAIAEQMNALVGDPSLRAVVLTGAGRAFSAGGDLAMIESMARQGSSNPGDETRREISEFMRRFYALYLSVRDLPCPTIAALNGAAIGAGLCIALACDTRVAARDAKLGLNFTRLGIHPGMGATWNLPRIVGPAHAAELLFTGRILDGAEAERIGLVNRAVDVEAVLPEALEMARAIALSAPIAVRGTKRALARSLESDLAGQLDFEAHQQSLCCESADLGEGLAAGRAKRPPQFRGN